VEGPSRAVAQVTKTGLVYVFDRVTGEPVVAESGAAGAGPPIVAGERASKASRFPPRTAIDNLFFQGLRDGGI